MAEPTLLPERLQYRPTKIELDESIEKAKATLLKKIKRSVYYIKYPHCTHSDSLCQGSWFPQGKQ